MSCRTEHVQSCRRIKDACPSSSPFPASQTPSTQPTPFHLHQYLHLTPLSHLPSTSSPTSTPIPTMSTTRKGGSARRRRISVPPPTPLAESHLFPLEATLYFLNSCTCRPQLDHLLARLMDRSPGRTDVRKSTRARSTGGRPSHRGTLLKPLPATGPLPKVSMSTWRLSRLTPPPAATREMTRTSSPTPCPTVHPRPYRRLLSAKTLRAKASPC